MISFEAINNNVTNNMIINDLLFLFLRIDGISSNNNVLIICGLSSIQETTPIFAYVLIKREPVLSLSRNESNIIEDPDSK